jgi:hypothetical protein
MAPRALRTYVEAAAGILAQIQPVRVVALLLGTVAQAFVIATNRLQTPEMQFALTDADRQRLNLIEVVSEYGQTVNLPFSKTHLALLAVFVTIAGLNLIIFLRTPSRHNATTIFLLSLGSLQPVLAFLKQQERHTLTSTSHYYYFFGVICFCTVPSLAREFIKERSRAVTIGFYAALACAFVAKPHYLVRAPLVDMDWPLFSAKINDGTHETLVPLNPNWRAVIPPRRP